MIVRLYDYAKAMVLALATYEQLSSFEVVIGLAIVNVCCAAQCCVVCLSVCVCVCFVCVCVDFSQKANTY